MCTVIGSIRRVMLQNSQGNVISHHFSKTPKLQRHGQRSGKSFTSTIKWIIGEGMRKYSWNLKRDFQQHGRLRRQRCSPLPYRYRHKRKRFSTNRLVLRLVWKCSSMVHFPVRGATGRRWSCLEEPSPHVWWCTPLISACSRQVDLCEFDSSHFK